MGRLGMGRRILYAGLVLALACERPVPRQLRGVEDDSGDASTGTAVVPVATAAPVRPSPLPDTTAKRQALLEKRAAKLRDMLPGDFHIRYEWPFVVAGDLSRRSFDRIFENSLVGSYKMLRRDYFDAEPDRIIEVYLFKDNASYRYYADKLFEDDPSTPFGYYSPTHRALIMNIATGTGTLVHELCHPLIEHDFPRCPTWLNEGLASLHEQCTWRDGHLVGLPNWRLPDLQKSIRAGKPLPLKDLVAKTGAHGFYEQDEGLNYATARYLCQYLQQKGKLREFYSTLRRDIKEDPTGRKTIESLLGAPLDEIEPAWQRWVLSLRFER